MTKTEQSMKFAEKLAKIASSLERKGSTKTAAVIDSINKNLVSIKYAQYVGIQNYWIRNSRCWGNCWRQKRAENKALGAQEVWSKCYEEYLKSFNKSDSDWDKYAQDSNLIKTASQDVQDFVKEEANLFHKELTRRVGNDVPVPVAVNAIIKENSDKYALSIIDEANKLLKVAEKLKSKGKVKTAARIESIATEIIKEAGIRDWMQRGMQRVKNLFTGGTDNPKAIAGHLNKVLSEIGKIYSLAATNKPATTAALANLKKYLNTIILPIVSKSNNPNLKKLVATMTNFAQLPQTKGSGNGEAIKNLTRDIQSYLSGVPASAGGKAAPGAAKVDPTFSDTGQPDTPAATTTAPTATAPSATSPAAPIASTPPAATENQPSVTDMTNAITILKTFVNMSKMTPRRKQALLTTIDKVEKAMTATATSKVAPPVAVPPPATPEASVTPVAPVAAPGEAGSPLTSSSDPKMTKEAKTVLKQLKIKI